ncbi:hypothetical protein CHARACLAT_017826 [Characodon lateralis]|uniref:Uncharacterized protein n=1 Tax=Characodon lateralis TaxID=208331 RepID=A0ABU7CYJ8_9TELE|nr:hypothetical protein [Characodon lateralis]
MRRNIRRTCFRCERTISLRGNFQVQAPCSCVFISAGFKPQSAPCQSQDIKPSRIVLDQVPVDSPSASIPKT